MVQVSGSLAVVLGDLGKLGKIFKLSREIQLKSIDCRSLSRLKRRILKLVWLFCSWSTIFHIRCRCTCSMESYEIAMSNIFSLILYWNADPGGAASSCPPQLFFFDIQFFRKCRCIRRLTHPALNASAAFSIVAEFGTMQILVRFTTQRESFCNLVGLSLFI